MNKEELKLNLLKTINKIDPNISDNNYEILFKMIALEETNKNNNSMDEMMYLWGTKILPNENTLFTMENITNFLITPDSRIPTKVNISLVDKNNNKVIFLLEVSMKFRKEKGLDIKNYDYIPFRIKAV